MLEIFDTITNNAIYYMQCYGIVFGFLIIILESVLPFLPLCVFIALNIESFGMITGFLMSWVATIVGCLLSYAFFKFLVGNRLDKWKDNNRKLRKVIDGIKKIDFSKLVILVALPFAPAFLINIACGITKVKFKKFFASLLIGKTVIVYFWGFVGTSLIESITNVNTVMTICILLIVAFVISKMVVKKYDIE